MTSLSAWAVVQAGQHCGFRPDVLDDRPSDERRTHLFGPERRHIEDCFERLDLPSEGVAPHHDVEPAERLLAVDRIHEAVGEHDEAGARAEHRHPIANRFANRMLQTEQTRQLVDHARLAAGDHEA